MHHRPISWLTFICILSAILTILSNIVSSSNSDFHLESTLNPPSNKPFRINIKPKKWTYISAHDIEVKNYKQKSSNPFKWVIETATVIGLFPFSYTASGRSLMIAVQAIESSTSSSSSSSSSGYIGTYIIYNGHKWIPKIDIMAKHDSSTVEMPQTHCLIVDDLSKRLQYVTVNGGVACETNFYITSPLSREKKDFEIFYRKKIHPESDGNRKESIIKNETELNDETENMGKDGYNYWSPSCCDDSSADGHVDETGLKMCECTEDKHILIIDGRPVLKYTPSKKFLFRRLLQKN